LPSNVVKSNKPIGYRAAATVDKNLAQDALAADSRRERNCSNARWIESSWQYVRFMLVYFK